MFTTILLFIVVLGLLVFVHELGHFTMAKKMGMKVEEFGFGFPPRIAGWKRGDTIYSINWIPLGGFVKIKGESGEDRDHPDSFASKPAWRRFIVLVAGVVMNLLLAVVLLSIGFMMGLPSVVDDQTPASATVRDERIRIARVLEESPAMEAGIEPGQTLAAIDGRTFETADDARMYIERHSDDGLTFTMQKDDGSFYEATMTGRELSEEQIFGVGVGLIKTGLVSFPVHEAIYQGTVATGVFTVEVVKAFYGLIKNLVIGQGVSVELSGPVGIAVLTGEVAALGLVYLLQFTAILSINLAVINILPFPALDGGRVLFLIIEKALRRPVDQRIEAVVHNLGFLLLMILVVLVTYRDIVRYGGQITDTLKALIGA